MRQISHSNLVILRAVLLIAGFTAILTLPFSLPDRIGAVDFRPYWASTYLFARGADFSDLALLDQVERALTGWREPHTMAAWFAPTGNLVLLPYTLFPFPRAVFYWLLTNIGIVFAAALLLWRGSRAPAWISLAAAFGFSMTLVSLIAGQVNTLELLGLALFLSLSAAKRPALAGASLALTTLKPHLVILTLPLLILDMTRRKQWRALAGFGVALAVCAVLLFALRPAWPASFWHVVTTGMGDARQVPTLTGLLVLCGEYVWGQWIWVAGLIIAVLVWWRYGREYDQRTLVDLSLMASLVVSPVGWSYDQILLLIPALRVLGWACDRSLSIKTAQFLVFALILVDAITFYQRVETRNEVWFFWVPFAIALIYAIAWHSRRRSSALEWQDEVFYPGSP